jgi:hypothetical protein
MYENEKMVITLIYECMKIDGKCYFNFIKKPHIFVLFFKFEKIYVMQYKIRNIEQ